MRIRRKKTFFNVPVSSLSDIAFLLLIFIMLIALINFRKEVRILFPVAENSKKVSTEKNLEVWIDGEGYLYLNGDPAALTDIRSGIIEAYEKSAETRVHIIADRTVPFMYVQQVLETLQLLQYRTVSFVVKDP